MKQRDVQRILKETAYVRMGGSAEELRCANYIKDECAKLGADAQIESFEVDMADILECELTADGIKIPCKGYFNAGSACIEAPFYYLRDNSDYSLSQCKDHIVMIDGYMGYWKYQDLIENGAVGFITYDGNTNYADRDIDQRELRSFVSKGNKIPGVNINAKDAVNLIKKKVSTVKINLKQNEYIGKSHNVVLDIPGESDKCVVFTAHYDSTSLSQGAYDNMSGSIGLLALAEHFSKTNSHYSTRFIWCGSEERGLLGSKAYCKQHKEELKNVVLNINLDMVGCIMGKMIACCTSEEKLMNYIEYFAMEYGMDCKVSQDVYSSDSTPFADCGVPAVSFARIAPHNTATIHNRYDTAAVMSPSQTIEDMNFIIAFSNRMAQAKHCPVTRVIPDNMKEKLDEYLARKRPKNA